MDLTLWIAQILLALMFTATGLMKTLRSREALATVQPWVDDVPQPVVRLAGVAEILGALGLVLPAVAGIAVTLVPVAAVGLMAVMVGAVVVHARRGETQAIVVNVALLAVAAFVAWGRFGPYAS